MIHTDGKRTIANAEVSAAEGIIQRLEEKASVKRRELQEYVELDLALHDDYCVEILHIADMYADARGKADCARRLQRAAKKGRT